MDILMEDTSVSTGEPSINQLERDLEKEGLEQEKDFLQREIRTEILKQYKKDVGKRHFLMSISFRYNVFNRTRVESDVNSILDNLELDEFANQDLEEFLLKIREDKSILLFFFKDYWP